MSRATWCMQYYLLTWEVLLNLMHAVRACEDFGDTL